MVFNTRKLIAWAVVFAFVGSLFVQPAQGASQADLSPSVKVTDISIPGELGEIREKFEGSSGRLVVYLQDAHVNYSAQMTLAKLISYFSKKYPIELVGIEGHSGEVDLSLYRAFSENDLKNNLLVQEVHKGHLTGAEYAAMTDPEVPDVLYGVEENGLYVKNLQLFLNALKLKETHGRDIERLRRYLANIKDKIYPAALLEMERSRRKFDEKAMDFKSYYEFLNRLAAQEKILVTKGGALLELDELLSERSKKLELDSGELFRELRQMEDAIEKALLKTNEQKEASLYARYFDHLQSLFELKLTREEFQKFRLLNPKFNQADLIRFIRSVSSQHHLKADDLTHLEELDLGKLATALGEFYETAEKRDSVLVANLQKRLEKSNASIAILITGGYHAEGILESLKKANYSFLSIAPRITSVSEDSLYEQAIKATQNFFKTSAVAVPISTSPLVTEDFDNSAAVGNYRKHLLQGLAHPNNIAIANRNWTKGVLFEYQNRLFAAPYEQLRKNISVRTLDSVPMVSKKAGKSLGLSAVIVTTLLEEPALANKENFEKILGELDADYTDNRAEALRAIPLFLRFNPELATRDVAERVLARLNDREKAVRLEARETLRFLLKRFPNLIQAEDLQRVLNDYLETYASNFLSTAEREVLRQYYWSVLLDFAENKKEAFDSESLYFVLESFAQGDRATKIGFLPILHLFSNTNPSAFTRPNFEIVERELRNYSSLRALRTTRERMVKFLKWAQPSFITTFAMMNWFANLFSETTAIKFTERFEAPREELLYKELIVFFAQANLEIFQEAAVRLDVKNYFDDLYADQPLNELIKVDLSYRPSRKRDTEQIHNVWPQSHPDRLAREFFRKQEMDFPSKNEISVSVNYDTGFGKYRDRGKFIALAMHFFLIEPKELKTFEEGSGGVTPFPPGLLALKPRSEDRGLEAEYRIENLAPGRLEYRLIFSEGSIREKSRVEAVLKSLSLLNLGLLLANDWDQAEAVLGEAGFIHSQQAKSDIANTYRLFERDLVRLLRKYDVHRDPNAIQDVGDGHHEERVKAAESLKLEEALDPQRVWIASPYEVQGLGDLMPYLRNIEGISLSQQTLPNGKKVGNEFLKELRSLVGDAAASIETILRGKGLKFGDEDKDLLKKKDPFIDSKEPDASANYLVRVRDALRAGVLSRADLWDAQQTFAGVQAGKSLGAVPDSSAGLNLRYSRKVGAPEEDEAFMSTVVSAMVDKKSFQEKQIEKILAIQKDKTVQVMSAKALQEFVDIRARDMAAIKVISRSLRKDIPLLVLLEAGDEKEAVMQTALQLGFSKDKVKVLAYEAKTADFGRLLQAVKTQEGMASTENIKMFIGLQGDLDRVFALLSKQVPDALKPYFEFQPLSELKSLIASFAQIARVQQLVSAAA